MASLSLPVLLVLIVCVQAVRAQAPAAAPLGAQLPVLAVVRTPLELQNAVRARTRHVVIAEHLNLTVLEPWSDVGIQNDGILEIPLETWTIRGNCSGPPVGGPLIDPPLTFPGQCVLHIREDFMATPVENGRVWLHQLYIRLVGDPNKDQSTLIGANFGDVWLTDSALIGDGNKGRAVDVDVDRKFYARNVVIQNFSKDQQAGFRLRAGATGAFLNVTFRFNVVSSGAPETVVAGPHGGLEETVEDVVGAPKPASAWFEGCTFEDGEAPLPGDVAIESAACRVFTSTPGLPTLYDKAAAGAARPWLTVPLGSGEAAAAAGSASVFEGRDFITEGDAFWQTASLSSSTASGLPRVPAATFPDPATLSAIDPGPTPPGPGAAAPAGAGGDDDDTRTIVIAVVVGGLGLGALLAALAVFFWCRRAHAKADESEYHSAKPPATWPSGSEYMSVHSGSAPAATPGAGSRSGVVSRALAASGALPGKAGSGEAASQAVWASHDRASAAGGTPGPPISVGSSRSRGTWRGGGGGGGGDAAVYYDAADLAGAGAQRRGSDYGQRELQAGLTPEAAAALAASAQLGADGRPRSLTGSAHSDGRWAGLSQPGRAQADAAAAAAGGPRARRQSSGSGSSGGPARESLRSGVSSGYMMPNLEAVALPALPPRPPGTPSDGGSLGGSEVPGCVWPQAPLPPVDEMSAETPGEGGGGRRRAAAAAPPLRQRRRGDGTVTTTADAADRRDAARDAALALAAGAAAVGYAAGSPGTPNNTMATGVTLPPLSPRGRASAPAPQPLARGGGVAAAAAAVGTLPLLSATTGMFDETVAGAADGSAADVPHERVVDMLEDVRAASAAVLGRYALLSAVQQRLGGSCVTAFARAADVAAEAAPVALKFYCRRAPFDRTAALFATPAARRLMPAVLEVAANNQGVATGGVVLPPCVVLRRGEPLEEWATRTAPHLPSALHALCQIAALLSQLHAGGYVLYGLKPSNVAWFREERCWALIDFGCAARAGASTPLSFSLNYAAPEVVKAQEAGAHAIPADPAADVWALGVVAYELLSGSRSFPPGTPPAEIRNAIAGRLPLPWEEVEPRSLRTLRPSVLSCLSRAPAERPSSADVFAAWTNLLDFAAVEHTKTGR